MLLLLFNPQGSAATTINVSDVIQRTLPALGAYRLADLTHWTEEELFEYADEGIKRLARAAGMFAERDAATAVVAGTANYSLPARHLSTIHVSLDGANLLPVGVRELEALDSAWRITSETPERYAHDEQGAEIIRLYPIPVAGGTLAQIYHQTPPEITQAAPALTAPSIFEDALAWLILAAARAKESDAAMPEVAAHAEQRVQLFEQIMRVYWGGSV